MNNRNYEFLLLIPAIVITLLLLLAINGARGSDQFWYLADTQALVLGAPAETNARFPGMILRQNNGDPQTYFLHNGPTLFINAALGKMIGSFNAWKASNIAILLLSALFTALTVSRLTNRIWGVVAFSLFVVSPIAVWQAANLLREPFLGLLTAMLMYLLLSHDNKNASTLTQWLIVPVLFIGMLSHPMFLVLSVIYIVYAAFWLRSPVISAITALATVIALVMKSHWFPSSFQPGISTIIASAIPGKTNMLWQLSDTVEPITSGLLIDKLVHALEMQFANIRLAPMYLITNAGIASFLILLVHRKDKLRKFLIYSFLIISAFVGIAILMQNQPRYQMISAPVTVACLVVLLHTLGERRSLRYALLTAIALLLSVDLALLHKARKDVLAHNQEVSLFRESFAKVPSDANIAVVGTSVGRYIRLTYALAPRKVLTVDTDVLEPGKIITAIKLFNPDYLVFESEPPFNKKPTDSKPVFMLKQPDSINQMPVYEFDEQLLDFNPISGG